MGWDPPEPHVSPGLPCDFRPALLIRVNSVAAARLRLPVPGVGPASLSVRRFGVHPDLPAVSMAGGLSPLRRQGSGGIARSRPTPSPASASKSLSLLRSHTIAPGLKAEGFLFSFCFFFFFFNNCPLEKRDE